MQNKVLNDQVYEICEIYIDDVLIHGKSDPEFLTNTRRAFDRFRDKKVAVNPRKLELDLEEDECVMSNTRGLTSYSGGLRHFQSL